MSRMHDYRRTELHLTDLAELYRFSETREKQRRRGGPAEVLGPDSWNDEKEKSARKDDPDCCPQTHASQRQCNVLRFCGKLSCGPAHIKAHQCRHERDHKKEQRCYKGHVDRQRGGRQNLEERENNQIHVIFVCLFLEKFRQLQEQHQVNGRRDK